MSWFVLLTAGLALADIPPTRPDGTAAVPEPAGAVPASAAAEPSAEPSAESDIHPLFGPQHVDLGHDLGIDLPEGFLLVEKAEAQKISEQNGNFSNETLVALIAPADGTWIMNVEYEDAGYVSDDDANELDPDALLQSYKDGTEAGNAERTKRGFSALHVDGWSESPRYEAVTHRLAWGLIGHDDEGQSVNYFTRVLGRRGYASLDLIASPEVIDAAKVQSDGLVKGVAFGAGARYEDFDASTDKVAEYGIAALVMGGAGAMAAKSGLLAKLLALLLAGKKVIAVGVVALIAGAKRLFGGKESVPPAA